jgi:hypothetical protein
LVEQKNFGVPNPGPQMAIRPFLVRANTVAFWKKQFRSSCQIVCTAEEQVQTMEILQSALKSMILSSILGSCGSEETSSSIEEAASNGRKGVSTFA